MKNVLALVFSFAIAVFCYAGSNPGFESMKSLAGNWKGTGPDGKPFTVTFEVISGGSVVLERMNEEQMVTTYYPDGDGVMMTHYCMSQNQPRMKSNGMDGNSLNFKFVDATNLATPDAGHMHGLVLTMQDADHIEENWTWNENGKSESHAFKLEKVK
jgi:hypothetical protein